MILCEGWKATVISKVIQKFSYMHEINKIFIYYFKIG